ncbi:VirK family protein, partial [Burkholderia pseudomallei]
SFPNANSSEGAFLESAEMSGNDIHVILYLSRCIEHGTHIPGPAVRGSVRPETLFFLSDNSIAFSNTHFTVPADNKP